MHLHTEVTRTICIRPTFDGRPAKPEALAHQGKTVAFYVSWGVEDGETYAGEFALVPVEPLPGIVWIASGDTTEPTRCPNTGDMFQND